jgi:hypothetical protein
MKAAAAFNHPVSGEKVMPGQSFDEKGLDKDELEDLKKRGYLADGDGYKAGEKVDLSKLSSTELRNYAGALGIDTGSLRDRTRLEGAINAKQAAPAPPAEQKQATLTFGPGTEGASASEETISAEDHAKASAERAKARADSEKSMAQSAGNKEKAAEAVKQADANLKAAGSKSPPPERKPAGGDVKK